LCGRGAAWADGLMAADEDALVKEVSAATAEAPCRGVCVTCGRRGAMLRLGAEAWYGRGDPPGRIVNTCGAGDAFLAGYLWGLAAGDEPPERLRKALACGTVSCMAEGTAEVDARLVERLLPDVTILPVA